MANLYSNEILETNNYYVSSNYKNSDNLLSITTEQTEEENRIKEDPALISQLYEVAKKLKIESNKMSLQQVIEFIEMNRNISSSDDYFFNEKFQKLLEMDDSYNKNVLLSEHTTDFVYAVETFGKIIISERYLPYEEKTIKPIKLGGIAGGEKYVHRGILYKFAVDVPLSYSESGKISWMYGKETPNDHLAIKAAGNELKALTRFYGASRGLGLCVPLMSLVDYHGYRLIAVPLLPISKETIIYGSANGGISVHNEDKELHKKMGQVAQILNIQVHKVNNIELYGPGDLEVHQGKDNRQYVLDFGRYYPPEAPKDPNSRSIYYECLRPELVLKNKVPLCSDAFSSWQEDDPHHREYNEEVKRATDRLFNEIIPTFSRKLNERSIFPSLIWTYVHSYGINYRHLGKVRTLVTEKILNFTILTEMWVRIVKNLLNEKFRHLMQNEKLPSDIPYKKLTVKILNFFFCPQSKWFHWYWTAIDENPPDFKDEEIYKIPSLKFSIIKKFGSDALTPEEQKPSHGILSKVLFGLFFKRLETLTSIKFSAKAKEYVEVKSHNDSFQLVETDIDSLELRVKHMSLVDLCSGSALLDRAFQSQSEDEIKRLLETATERLLKAWNSYSENEQVLYQFGVANWKLAQLRTTIMARTALTEDYKEKINLLNLYDLAIDNFEKASQNNDRNFHYFLKAGYALCDCVLVDKYDQKKIQSAGSHIEKAISLNNESLNNKILKLFTGKNSSGFLVVFIPLIDMNNNLLQFVGKTLIHFQKTNSLTLTFNEMSLMQKQFLLNEHLSSVVQKLKSKFPELVFYSFDFSYFPDLQKSTVETLVNSFGASLQELNISHLNSMDDKTLKNIFNACTSLKNFIADHCTLLTEKSFEAIPKSLESLSLKFCTGINTKKLVQLLKKNSSWKLINLQDSGFNESQADELKKSFPKTQVLHGKSTISNPLSYSFRLENE